jgi:PAS domain-containing protein
MMSVEYLPPSGRQVGQRFVEPLRERRLSPWQQPDANLAIDNSGHIVECNQPALAMFGLNHGSLLGHAVTEVIPTLPLSPQTPGYNLAYGIFHSAATHAAQHLARTAQQTTLPVHVTFARLLRHGQHILVLSLKPVPA